MPVPLLFELMELTDEADKVNDSGSAPLRAMDKAPVAAVVLLFVIFTVWAVG